MQKIYKTTEAATAAFIRNGKKDGTVKVLGGGWWHVKKIGKVQGFGGLEVQLRRRGLLHVDPTTMVVTLTVADKPAKAQHQHEVRHCSLCAAAGRITECSTHPDAAHPLAPCGDCGAVTCLDHRIENDPADRCVDCAAAFYLVEWKAEEAAAQTEREWQAAEAVRQQKMHSTVTVQDTAKDMPATGITWTHCRQCGLAVPRQEDDCPRCGKTLPRKPGRPKQDVTKVPLCIRIDADLLDRYRASGDGWQTRMQDILRTHAPRKRKAGAK